MKDKEAALMAWALEESLEPFVLIQRTWCRLQPSLGLQICLSQEYTTRSTRHEHRDESLTRMAGLCHHIGALFTVMDAIWTLHGPKTAQLWMLNTITIVFLASTAVYKAQQVKYRTSLLDYYLDSCAILCPNVSTFVVRVISARHCQGACLCRNTWWTIANCQE